MLHPRLQQATLRSQWLSWNPWLCSGPRPVSSWPCSSASWWWWSPKANAHQFSAPVQIILFLPSSPLLWLQRISKSWSGQPAATPRICVNDDRSPQKLACVFSTSLQIFFAPGCIVLFHWFSFGSFLSKHYLQQESLYMWLAIPVLGCRLPASRACPELSFLLAAVWGERIEIDRVAQDSLERKPTMHLFLVNNDLPVPIPLQCSNKGVFSWWKKLDLGT